MTTSNIKLMPNQIAIQLAEVKDRTPGGIILPAGSKEAPEYGTVIALGAGRKVGSKLIPFEVSIGDKVLLPKYAGTQVKIDDDNYYLIVQEHDILAVVD